MSNGAYFVLGLGVGLSIGAIAVLIVKNRDRIQCEEEIESVKTAYREAFHVVKDDVDTSVAKKSGQMANSSEFLATNRLIDYNKYASLVRDDPREPIVMGTEYEPKPVASKDEEESPFNEEDEVEHPSEGYPEAPYVIGPEEYAEYPEYAKEDLYYYVYSDTMVDEHEVEVDDIDGLIGHDNLRHMGEIEPGCLWIRSPNVMTDYQIVAIKSTWEG